MKKVWFALLVVLALVGCQQEEEPTSEFTLGNVYPSQLQTSQTYTFVTSLEWEGEEGTKLQSIQLTSDEEMPPSLGRATFYIGEPTKKTGLYQREEIGEKQKVQGYTMEENQTLIMKISTPEVPTDQMLNVRFTYEVGGEQFHRDVEWDTLNELVSRDLLTQKRAEPLEEKPTFSLTEGGKELPFQVVSECWGDECSEKADLIEAEVQEVTRDVEPVQMASGSFLEVEIEGQQPDSLQYKRLVDSIFVEERLREGVLSFEKVGTHRVVVTGLWYDDQGLFQGRKTVALVVDVTEDGPKAQ